MSQTVPCGRPRPTWSTLSPPQVGSALSIAGLPKRRMCTFWPLPNSTRPVCIRGSVLDMFPLVLPRPQLVPASMLWPGVAETTLPEQADGEAKMLFWTVAAPEFCARSAPEAAVLLANVTLVRAAFVNAGEFW